MPATHEHLDRPVLAMLARYPHGCVLADDVAYEVPGFGSSVSAATLMTRLRRHGLVERDGHNWRITKRGLAAL